MTIRSKKADGNLAKHAIRELKLCGQTAEDEDFARSLVEAVRGFTSYYGHSGGSHAVGVEMLYRLLNFKTLSPIRPDDEWVDHTDISGTPLWQCVRDSGLFSTDGGKTYYDIDEEGQPIHTVEAA